MTAPPLDYVSRYALLPRRRWPARVLACAGAIGCAVILLPTVTVRQVESRVDAVTGSMVWTTTWLGVRATPRNDVSPLEARLAAAGIPWKPSWWFLHDTHRNVFGRATCFECGAAPPILELRPALQAYAASATDDELREFVRVMQQGTTAQQEAAVQAAMDQALAQIGRTPVRRRTAPARITAPRKTRTTPGAAP